MLARLAGSAVMAALVLSAGTLAASAAAPAANPANRDRPDTVKRIAESVGEVEDDNGTCNRARRRLWVEGEGWVVRRITICR